MARTLMCGRGGIGRRAALRSLWGKTRGSSSLLGRTNSFPFISFKPLKYNDKLYFNVTYVVLTLVLVYQMVYHLVYQNRV